MKKDKEWLLRELKKIPHEFQDGYLKAKAIYVLPLIDELDEPEKVVIPQFVADYIRFSKKGGHSPRISMDEAHISKELNDWLAKTEDYAYYPNQEKFMRAWLEGYVIEKEQLYYVVIPTDDLNWKYYYLDNDGGIDMTDEKLSITHHTESFIRSVSDELWQFAQPVEEETL